ncbi:MAG: arabinose isomerase, partial [Clostridia bacterium]|nr:arabinose isomerase [Clostridia bacterium]
MIERKHPRQARIGIFAVAHATYWAQFPGLEDNIMGYHRDFCDKVRGMGVEVVDFGMVDENSRAYEILPEMKAANVDVLFCNMVTYATSSVFAPIVKGMDVPMVLVALQPRKAMDYTKASTFMQLENDNICSVPEFIGVAIRMGKKVNDVIIGTLYNDEEADLAVKEWCDIACVLHSLKGARVGLLGHVLEAMYDMHADPTAISDAFGLHVPLLEIEDVIRLYNTVTEEEIAQKSALILREFDTPTPVSDPVTMKLTDADLRQAAKTAVALDKLVEAYNLTGLA